MRSFLAFFCFAACVISAPPDARLQGEIQLVETVPVETSLGTDAIPDTFEVWLEMFAGAKKGIELAFFYASNNPEDPEKSRLEPLLVELEQAAARGVKVRFLSDIKFYKTYPKTLDRLGAHDGIETRLFDIQDKTGGILHAKYFVVDGREAYLGSANFDWRSLEHIQELGVRFSLPAVVLSLGTIFEMDWSLAHPDGPQVSGALESAAAFPTQASFGGGDAWVTPVYSPPALWADPDLWDLPRLIEMIDSSKESVSIQLLSYRTTDREGRYFADLETALRSAAARGVQVRLLLADWSKREYSIEGLQSLQALKNIEVKLAALPEARAGFIPFARVIHAKYMVVDRVRSWVGTSNWGRDYFHNSRNVGLIVESERLGAELAEFFDRGWGSPYAETVDPSRRYEPPRVQ